VSLWGIKSQPAGEEEGECTGDFISPLFARSMLLLVAWLLSMFLCFLLIGILFDWIGFGRSGGGCCHLCRRCHCHCHCAIAIAIAVAIAIGWSVERSTHEPVGWRWCIGYKNSVLNTKTIQYIKWTPFISSNTPAYRRVGTDTKSVVCHKATKKISSFARPHYKPNKQTNKQNTVTTSLLWCQRCTACVCVCVRACGSLATTNREGLCISTIWSICMGGKCVLVYKNNVYISVAGGGFFLALSSWWWLLLYASASFPSFEGGKEMKEMKTNLWTHTRKAKTKTATDKNTLSNFFFFFLKQEKKNPPSHSSIFASTCTWKKPNKKQLFTRCEHHLQHSHAIDENAYCWVMKDNDK